MLAAIPAGWEVVVVDDGSSPPLQLSAFPHVKTVRLPHRRGAAAARNAGAARVQEEWLFFLDGDVIPEPGALARLRARAELGSGLVALFGAYSLTGFVGEPLLSRFRNLLHSYVHRRHHGRRVGTFWAGLGAVRRCAFQQAGGFDESVRGVEDAELGARLSGAILVDAEIEGKHLKAWTLSQMLQTDLWMRAEPWMRLALQGKLPLLGLNSGSGALFAALALVLQLWPGLRWPGLLCYGLACWPVYRFMFRHGGWRLGLASPLCLALHHVVCWLGAAVGGLNWWRQPR